MNWTLLRQTLRHWWQRGLSLLPRADWRPWQQRLRYWFQAVANVARQHWSRVLPKLRLAQQSLSRIMHETWTPVRQRLPQGPPAWWPGSDAPPAARRIVDAWHSAECWLAVACFGFIAGILILDVLGREFLGPFLRLIGFDPGPTGIFASQKLSIFALVIGSFAGIGIATATGAHIVPGFAAGWVPQAWKPAFDRAADLITGLFLVGVTWFGLKFVGSSFQTDLRAPVLDWPVWPIQLSIPLGFLSAAGRYFVYAAWPALKPAPPEFQE
jgi:TRAP-type C4-dicarboxylate transport system permease small subunit